MRFDSESSLPLVDYEQGSVGTTWTMSFKAIEARNENASNLLRLWAFFDNKELWQAASDGGEQWPGWLCDMAYNEVRFLDAARLLLCYSMIKARESVQGSGSYSIHPVVHRWTSHIQDDKKRRLFLRLAMMVVGFSVPDSKTKDYWVLQQRLLPHAERCSWWAGGSKGANINTTNVTHILGNIYVNQSRLGETEAMYQRVLSVFQATGAIPFITRTSPSSPFLSPCPVLEPKQRPRRHSHRRLHIIKVRFLRHAKGHLPLTLAGNRKPTAVSPCVKSSRCINLT
ncbi:hypothetical protein QBC36DRAFT_247809 [Triangularia setosa]|uniref:Uncharacterized protein n=1 Tax=Triangularia setosa TaxID=2587417 RepID=A0AAN6W151_9PEZI|nr:hypothetical protein QBC36DRAFT_247809 [Podospora setosa]